MCWIRFLVILMLIPLSKAAGQSLQREWSDASGKFKVDAVLTEVSKDKVQLKRSDGKEVSVPLDRLSETDKLVVQVVQQSLDNEREFNVVEEHLKRAIVSPLAVAEILDVLQKRTSSGFAAGFYGGIVNALTGNAKRLALAKEQMDETIRRLRNARNSFPSLHEQTFTSALNNRAIVALRDGSPDIAAGLLAQAAHISEPIPFAVYHNATLLIEVGVTAKAANLKYLSEESTTKLAEIIAMQKPEAPETKVPARYVYCFAHDSFDSLIRDPVKSTDESNAKPEIPAGLIAGYEQLSNGSGFLISERHIITNRHVVEGHEKGLQFILRNATSFDRGEFARVVKVSSEKDVDLALLELKDARTDIAPIPIRGDLPVSGETLIVLGYPLGDVLGEQLQSSQGSVNSMSVDQKEIVHDAASNQGNSGGPCLDNKGNTIGVIYAGLRKAVEGSQRNFSVSNHALNEFLNGVNGFSNIAPRQVELSAQKVIQLVRDAVVRVEVYGTASHLRTIDPQTSSDARPSISENLFRFKLFIESTCLRCKGTGRFRCPYCRNGTVSLNKREQVATNPINGQPIIGNRVYNARCDNCEGRGAFNCPHCENGRLSLQD